MQTSSTSPDVRIPGRRAFLGTLAAMPWLSGCTTPLPLIAPPDSDASARQRLRDCADAHGLTAYRGLNDINVSYEGQWRPLIGRIQPEIVDPGYRGSSQERLMPAAGVTGQAYDGPSGRKHVVWRRGPAAGAPTDRGEAIVWLNGQRNGDVERQAASALVAESYGLFLLGPLWLADRGLSVTSGGSEQVDGRACDVVNVWLVPGLGKSRSDRAALCIDRVTGLMRRVRFTLEGFTGSQGAVAEVDTFDHERRFGVTWPMRSYERVVHPIALPAHDWHITGLDVNRGYPVDALLGPVFTGDAARPAARL